MRDTDALNITGEDMGPPGFALETCTPDPTPTLLGALVPLSPQLVLL